jgi:asparagine synthase (glutamine-hydrolysing)
VRLGPVAGWASALTDSLSAELGPDRADEAREAVRALAAEAAESGVRNLLQLKMWADLTFATADANYRLPDISGLHAQVEVRSPYLDHRVVEFAAGLRAGEKVARPLWRPVTKALPKRVYARMVSHDLAYSRKKGMGANLRWDRLIAEGDQDFVQAFDEAYAALDDAGIDSRAARTARDRFVADRVQGLPGGQHAARMMGDFMLGRWLMRTRAMAGVGAAAAP